MTAPRATLLENLRLALWIGTAFGLLEGAVLVWTRAWPAIQAAHKLSPDVLWIAPLVQIVLLGLAAIGLALAARVVPALGPRVATVAGSFVALGTAAVIGGPGVLHPASVAVIAGGIGISVARIVRDREAALLDALRRWLPATAILVLIAFAGTTLAGRLTEWARARSIASSPRPRPPNVLLLILDTVRRDRFFQGTHVLAPTLERLASRGVVFRNAWAAASWSLPSHATLLTGRLPHQHGADWPRLQLWDSVPTLAQSFAARGYVTGAFSSNNSWVTPEYLGRGFVRFEVYTLDDLWRRTAGGRLICSVLHTLGERKDRPTAPASLTSARLERFLDDYPGRPFFAYLTYMDVNRAYYDDQLNHPRWRDRPPISEGIAAYDAELTRVDAELDRLFADLGRRGLLEHTIVVVASDHGESFGTLDYYDHEPKGHGSSLYPEQIRVPLFVVAPGRVPQGLVLDVPVTLADVAGLLVGLAGSDDTRFGHPDLLARIGETAHALPDTGVSVFASLEYDRHSARSVVLDQWQYILNLRPDTIPEQVFDLATDSLARHNLAGTSPLLPRFRALLQQYQPAMPAAVRP